MSIENQMVNLCDLYAAVATPELSFRRLRPILKQDRYGNLLTYAQNNALVVRASLDGVDVAIKCYLNPRKNLSVIVGDEAVNSSPLLLPMRLYRDEVVISSVLGEAKSRHDVVLTPWAKQGSLDSLIAQAVRGGDRELLASLAERFDRLALALLDAPFAHGDVKPENIVVADDGEFRLIDLDAMWTPELTRCEELGTAEYQHPRRDAKFFGPHIDDYPIALISVALHALAELPHISVEGAVLPFGSGLVESTNEAYREACAHFRKSGNVTLQRLAEQLTKKRPMIDNLRVLIAELLKKYER